MSNVNCNEELREACCLGNMELIQTLLLMGAEINSKNSVNGMTALHWGAVRNNELVVSLCLQNGADPTLPRYDGKLPCDLTSNVNIRHDLGADCNTLIYNLNNNNTGFTPNYLKNPEFPYCKTAVQSNNFPIIDNKLNEKITIKMKLKNDKDFIEYDLSKDDSFEQFKTAIYNEFNLCGNNSIKLIRKLPNVLIRNDKDLQRLKEGNELEIELVLI